MQRDMSSLGFFFLSYGAVILNNKDGIALKRRTAVSACACPVIHTLFSQFCPPVGFFPPFSSPFCSFLSIFSQSDVLGELHAGQLAVSHPSSQLVIGKPHKKLLLHISPPSYLQGVHCCLYWVSVKCYQQMLTIISMAIALLCWRLQTGIFPLLVHQFFTQGCVAGNAVFKFWVNPPGLA